MEVEEMPEIELSSDEEVDCFKICWSSHYISSHYKLWKASDDGVALIVLKRPPVTEKKIEEIEVFALKIK